MRDRGWWLLWAAVLLAAFLSSSPASAAQGPAQPVIQDVVVQDRTVTMSVVETELPVGATGQDSVAISVDGVRVPAVVTASDGRTGRPAAQRTVVLVLDTSGSMQGAGLRDAQRAAHEVLRGLPADVRVGLVTFAGEVALEVPPTLDRALLGKALEGLTAGGRTRLYDAVPVALGAAGAVGERRLMVLSDGKDDDVSSVGVAQAAAAIAAAGVTVDVVDASADGSGAGLGPLADAGRGRSVSASGARAVDVFREIAQTYATQLTLTATLPEGSRSADVAVRVEVRGVRGTLVEERVVPVRLSTTLGGAGDETVVEPAPRTSAFWSMLAAVGLGTFLLLALAVTTGDRRATDLRRTKEVLRTYGRSPLQLERTRSAAEQGSPIAASMLGLADRVLQRRGSSEKLALALDRAGLGIRPREWLLLWSVSALVGAALGTVLGGSVLPLAFGALCGWQLPRTLLAVRAARRQRAFLAALPDSLQLLSSSMSSGYSLAQALDALVQEGSEPMAGEIGRALAEARIGRSLEDALDSVGERMACEDFSWVVMAVRVQRQVGGNLSEVLGRVCTTMRDRAALRRQVQALSAEGRMSAYLLIALPIGLGAFMFFFRRDYFRPMYTETVGIVALCVTAVMMTVGTIWMNKLIKVEA